MTADISKIFRQILVDSTNVDFQRIVCLRESSRELTHHQLKTVTYGTASAPFLANRVLEQLAIVEGAKNPEASIILKRDFYVVDVLFGSDSMEQALYLQKELIELLAKGGFPQRKWSANDASSTKVNDIPSKNITVRFKDSDNETKKVLGLHCCSKSDCFLFSVNTQPIEVATIRIILSVIARLFDPHGWLSPIIIVAKMLMQELWLRKLEWDEALPRDLQERWNLYYNDLTLLENLKIPRRNGVNDKMQSVQLHGFSDASMKAYGAVVYLRVVDKNDIVKTTLFVAKSKAAPTLTTSVPRLELCAAFLLSKLLQQVKNEINLSVVPMYCWLDSTTVIPWLSKTPSTWPTFVANRVALIQTNIAEAKWNHVPADLNPADCISRGLTPNESLNHHLWWHGRSFLSQASENWPSMSEEDLEKEREKCLLTYAKREKKIKKTPEVNLNSSQIEKSHLEILSDRTSSWSKLIRVTALYYRFIDIIINHLKKPKVKFLTSEELNKAKIFWFKYMQECEFSSEIESVQSDDPCHRSSSLKSLTPFLDKNRLLRVKGRLENAPLPYDAKHPIILPRHRLTNLIIEQAHLRTLHEGPQLTLSPSETELLDT